MNRMVVVSLASLMLLLTPPAFGDEDSADEIMKKVAAKYQSLETYKSKGTIRSDIDMGGRTIKQGTSFSILLKKPNLYLISWEQDAGVMVQSGNVWSDGTQPYLYMGAMNSYSKMESDEIALGGATGISGGAAYTIPSVFFSVFNGQQTQFSRLKSPQHEEAETIAGEECYVISSSSTISKKETFWISKKSHLIRQYSRSLEAPEGMAIPKMSDEQIEEALKGMGQKVTEESKKKMRQTMERSRAMMKNVKLKGSTTETHTNVSTPELGKVDFAFTPPKGAELKESLFGRFLGGK